MFYTIKYDYKSLMSYAIMNLFKPNGLYQYTVSYMYSSVLCGYNDYSDIGEVYDLVE